MGFLKGFFGGLDDDYDDEHSPRKCLSCGSTRAYCDGWKVICPDCGEEMDIEDYDLKESGLSIEDVYPSEEEVLNREREDNGDADDDYGEVYDV